MNLSEKAEISKVLLEQENRLLAGSTIPNSWVPHLKKQS